MKQDLGFDLKKAVKAMQHYSNATDIQTILIDGTGKTLHTTDCRNDYCQICRCMCGLLPESVDCSSVHLYGSYQAERFGGKYVFFCPLGLVHWASPITVDNTMRGAILGGPIHMIEPEEFLLADLLSKYNLSESNVTMAIQLLKRLPVVSTDRVNSLSELLFMVTAQLSDSSWHQYINEQEVQDQTADISEYIHLLKTMGGETGDIPAYPIQKERELLSAISVGDKSLSQKLLNEILGHIFFSSGNNFEIIRARVLELVVLLSRAALEGGADIQQIFGLNYQYLNQLRTFQGLEELTPWLARIMERFTDYVFNLANVKHKDVIYKSIDYIRKNYMKRITLEDVAANTFLSPSYFSKIFKEEMDMNFNTYLNHIRIEMSKKLLADPSISMVEISNLVGFEDQSYFSKVFKKMTGLSPKRFRESRGQNKK